LVLENDNLTTVKNNENSIETQKHQIPKNSGCLVNLDREFLCFSDLVAERLSMKGNNPCILKS
jgi:hypothetical protein